MTALGVIIGRGLLSARPAAGTTGALYYATDNNSWYRDNGASWDVQNAAASSLLTTKGDLLTHSTLDARLPVGADGYQLQADSAQTLGIKWAAPSAVSLTTASAYLASDLTMTTAATNYDVVSLSLAAGTWLLLANLIGKANAASTYFAATLWDGTTHVSDTWQDMTTTAHGYSAALSAIVTPGSTTTYKLTAQGGDNGNKILANPPALYTSGNHGSYMLALKVA